ncbi:unnamed protein product [Paramecium sonneborni]|uniref:poly(ADP-ribose) glycohydrolase n=1 Tax=Paramecium sonneborni TaxID=65129 RepID=A0A8S1PXJ5_9CILI|nr:unnamed protein product [Paramecium sonneborni]
MDQRDQNNLNNQSFYKYPKLSKQQTDYLSLLCSPKDSYSAYPIIEFLNNNPKKHLEALQSAISSLNKNDQYELFQNTLPKMAQYSLELVENSPKKQLLISKGTIQFTRKEIYQFLSLAFFGLLIAQHDQFPDPCNLTYILQDSIEKAKCYLHYFINAREEQENELVTLERISFNKNYHIDHFFPNQKTNSILDLELWSNCNKSLKNIEFCDQYIEEQENSFLVDFANKYVGGGVLDYGCVQEEILFTIMPENIIAVLFCKVLEDDEVVLIKNSIRYSDYKGYGYSFQFVKREPKNLNQNILVLDAQDYSYDSLKQYQPNEILREINKSFIGFSLSQQLSNEEFLLPISTGKWGCGVFEGDCELKIIIQLIAFSASIANEDQQRKMIFSTFKDKKTNQYQKVLDDIIKKYKSVGNLFQQLLKMSKKYRVFEFLVNKQ